MCDNCGTYRSKEIVDTLAKTAKKEAKTKEVESKIKQEEVVEEDKPLSVEELSKK